MIVDDLKYPIGKYDEQPFSEKLKEEWIAEIAVLPQHLELVMQNLDVAQLHTAYRPGGWTVNQLVHHVADSHMNAYCRFKVALTEENGQGCPIPKICRLIFLLLYYLHSIKGGWKY